jgi:hypothetical protein
MPSGTNAPYRSTVLPNTRVRACLISPPQELEKRKEELAGLIAAKDAELSERSVKRDELQKVRSTPPAPPQRRSC